MLTLSKPVGDDAIPPALLAYVANKLRNDIYHAVMTAFQDSEITQAQLASRLGTDKGQLHRQLSGPSNWTLDTVAKLLFAINGHLVKPATFDADTPAPANHTYPSWMVGDVASTPHFAKNHTPNTSAGTSATGSSVRIDTTIIRKKAA